MDTPFHTRPFSMHWTNKSYGFTESGPITVEVCIPNHMITISNMDDLVFKPCFSDAEAKGLEICSFEWVSGPIGTPTYDDPLGLTLKRCVTYTARNKPVPSTPEYY